LDIRETINRHQKVSTVVVICVVLAGLVAIGMEIRSGNGEPPSKNFFTIDDGKTWFADSSNKLPPFDHDGGKAVRCYVFEGKNGKFAGLLEKYSDSTLKQLVSEAKRPTSIPVLVKKPGEKSWSNVGPDQEAMILMHISGPDGSDIELVMP
jgi:hypothetical protein